MPDKDLASPKRPRGRPRGAKTRVLRHDRALGAHHFAFLRSWFLRLDVRDAWQRYMAFSELSTDLRHIERRRAELLRQVLDAGHQLNLSLPADRQITTPLELLTRPPYEQLSAPLPSLDDFVQAQGLDTEFYSEAELLQEYRQFYHLDTVPDEAPAPLAEPDGVPAQVRALNQVAELLAREPQAEDRLDLWLSPALSRMLKGAGIGTLGALAQGVHSGGARWHTRATGLGARRAGNLVDWLAPLSVRFEHPITDEARRPVQQRRALRSAAAGASGPAAQARPAGRVDGPWAKQVADRTAERRADETALQQWLAAHGGSSATLRAYAKESERFLWWCHQVRGTVLAALDHADCEAYRLALAELPAAWVQPLPMPRSDPAWRPFRGPLSPASQKYALVVVRTLLDGLVAAGHLRQNPMRAVARQLTVPAAVALRAFNADEWAFIQRCLPTADGVGMPGVAGRHPRDGRRLALLLGLLAGTGVRLAELAVATTADLLHDTPAGTAPAAWLLRSPQGAERLLPLSAGLLALLRQHHADAAALGPLPCPAPLVCRLGETPPRWTVNADGALALHVPAGHGARALGDKGIYQTLKRFFRRVSQVAVEQDVPGLDPERLLAASTQWLRHTHGKPQVAAALAGGAGQGG